MIQSEAAWLSTGALVMGLDGVEIVMRTEETFGIEIPDKIAQQILTPKALSSTFDLDRPLKEILHKDQWQQAWVGIRAEVGQPEWPKPVCACSDLES